MKLETPAGYSLADLTRPVIESSGTKSKAAKKLITPTFEQLGINKDDLPAFMKVLAPKYRPFGQSFLYNSKLAGMPSLDFCQYLLNNFTYYNLIYDRNSDGSVKTMTVPWIPGHVHSGAVGPRKSSVMVLSKNPGRDEVQARRNFAGPSGRVWKSHCDSHGVAYDDWYITNVCKFSPPSKINKLSRAYLQELMAVLYAELDIVRPDWIICMGSDALCALFGSKAKLNDYRGTISRFDFKASDPDKPDWSAQVLVTSHPVNALDDGAMAKRLEEEMAFVCKCLKSETPTDDVPRYYEVIKDFDRLDEWVSERIKNDDLELSVDCEWAGNDPSGNPDHHYLRTIQFCWKEGHAVCLRLVDAEGKKWLAARGKFVLGQHLMPLFKRPGVRFIGQNMRSDLPWLFDLGIKGPELEAAIENGFDTMLASHVLDETSRHGLEVLTLRYTKMGRYDWEMEQWKTANPSHKYEGFKRAPDGILELYAMCDADVTFRIFRKQEAELAAIHAECLSRPYFVYPNGAASTPATLYYGVELAATLGIKDMEMNGVLVDRVRLDHLTKVYHQVRDEMVKAFRDKIGWPDFNYRSTHHIRAILFPDCDFKDYKHPAEIICPGEDVGNWRPGQATDHPVLSRVKFFHCQPVKDTGHGHGTPWDRIVDRGQTHLKNPSTDSDTLSILARTYDFPELKLLKNIKCVDQICKNFLRVADEDGEESGLAGHIRSDGRIHTTIGQLVETGRYSSSAPNMQNIPSKQEKLLQGLLKEYGIKEVYSLRSCFTVPPGHVLVSADYKSAELVVMACYSQDKRMMDIVLNPKRDLHLETCNSIFKLGLTGLEDLPEALMEEYKDKYKADRIKAKAVNFGIPYGLSAMGLQADLESEGVETTASECEDIIVGHSEMFPDLHRFLEQCAGHVTKPPYYFQSVWGRRRHFFPSTDDMVISEQEREAKNFPIQECVAECLSVAIARLHRHKRSTPGATFKMLLPIHDALLFQVPVPYFETFVTKTIPENMGVFVPGLNVKLETDIEIGVRWSEKPTFEEMQQTGLSDDLIKRFVKVKKAS